MRVLTHTVIEAEAGQPVKQLLLHLWGISGSFLSRLKFRQAITVNGAPVTVRFVPCPGDVLAADVSDLPGEHPHIRPVDFPLDILYEDEDLLVLNKPAGLAGGADRGNSHHCRRRGTLSPQQLLPCGEPAGPRHYRRYGRGKDRLHPCPMYGHAAHGRFPAGVPGRVRGHPLPGRGRH